MDEKALEKHAMQALHYRFHARLSRYKSTGFTGVNWNVIFKVESICFYVTESAMKSNSDFQHKSDFKMVLHQVDLKLEPTKAKIPAGKTFKIWLNNPRRCKQTPFMTIIQSFTR